MLFRRRKPLPLGERISRLLWPRRGWSRAFRYYSKRLLRLSGSPHSIAAGFAIGVGLSMTPLLGFHYILCLAISFLLRGNLVAAALGTTIGNPLTFPIIWVGTYEIGNLILGLFGEARGHLDFHDISQHLINDSLHSIWPIVEPMLIGSIPAGLISGAIAYALIYWAAQGFQSARRARFEVRRRTLHGEGRP